MNLLKRERHGSLRRKEFYSVGVLDSRMQLEYSVDRTKRVERKGFLVGT